MLRRPSARKGLGDIGRDDTVPIFSHDFKVRSSQAASVFAPRWVLLLKRIDPIHFLVTVFIILLGVTAYAV